MSSNDGTYVAVHGDETSVMSDPSLQYLEDDRRSSAGEGGLIETAQTKDGLAP